MDKNESEVEAVETENNSTEVETVETEESSLKRESHEKQEDPQAKVARLERELKRAQQKLGIAKEEKPKVERTPFTLGNAEKALLNANGIRGKDEYSLVTDFVANTGKELEEVMESKYFQSELRELRDTRESKMASDAANSAGRGNPSPSDSVEYWIAKDQLPPKYMTKLREDVVNARIAKESNVNPFA